MPSNPNDTVGANYVSVGGALGQQIDNNIATSGYLNTGWPNTTYTYTWPYTHDAEARAQIAKMEGEVKVLREMVAALVAGRPQPKPRKGAR